MYRTDQKTARARARSRSVNSPYNFVAEDALYAADAAAVVQDKNTEHRAHREPFRDFATTVAGVAAERNQDFSAAVPSATALAAPKLVKILKPLRARRARTLTPPQ